jgi:ketosteroid isomerase-like protein
MNQQAREIVRLEETFWQSMVEKDVDTAMDLIADECLITGPSGTMRSDPKDYRRMTEVGDWTLDRFEFSDVEVIFPVEDTAIIAYKVHQTGTMKGQKMDLNCADSTTWVRDGDEWKCALHTESIVGHMPLTN